MESCSRAPRSFQKRGRVTSTVMSGSVNLLQIELFGEFAEQHLWEQGPIEIQELMSLPVCAHVGIFGQVFGIGHARGCEYWAGGKVLGVYSLGFQLGIAIGGGRQWNHLIGMRGFGGGLQDSVSREEADQTLFQNFICGFAVEVRDFIFHYGFDIFATIFQHQFGTAGVVFEEVGDIEDALTDGDIARLFIVMRLDLCLRDRGKGAARHPRKRKECVGSV